MQTHRQPMRRVKQTQPLLNSCQLIENQGINSYQKSQSNQESSNCLLIFTQQNFNFELKSEVARIKYFLRLSNRQTIVLLQENRSKRCRMPNQLIL